jgi:hypothetical protein
MSFFLSSFMSFFVLDSSIPFFLPPVCDSLPSFSMAFFLIFSCFPSASYLPSLLASPSIPLFYITAAPTVSSATAIHANEILRRKDPLENFPG